MYCPSCGADNLETALRCARCGASLIERKPEFKTEEGRAAAQEVDARMYRGGGSVIGFLAALFVLKVVLADLRLGTAVVLGGLIGGAMLGRMIGMRIARRKWEIR
jgi:hypothetical protein